MGFGIDVPRHGHARRRNGARIRPRAAKGLKANQPAELAKALETLEKVRAEFNKAQPAV